MKFQTKIFHLLFIFLSTILILTLAQDEKLEPTKKQPLSSSEKVAHIEIPIAEPIEPVEPMPTIPGNVPTNPEIPVDTSTDANGQKSSTPQSPTAGNYQSSTTVIPTSSPNSEESYDIDLITSF
ncbi:hypothetical protein RCL_jg8323.t1 [Rhizophagus clarus]|uniref:Uncharacterized protein n=1 Tax=Rhizophagus clarus TaxID=94130 RepID=A0A8H3MF16_9GLOM|nr:hypothetical protein RCL_jg8323.t1 [Rhizophagus clarus]